jgi:hypothetical protein
LDIEDLNADGVAGPSVDKNSQRVTMASDDLSAPAKVAAIRYQDPMPNLEVMYWGHCHLESFGDVQLARSRWPNSCGK